MQPPRYVIAQGNLADEIGGQYDVIAANIVADAIIMLSPDVPRLLAAGGVYIVSGIIDDREKDVQAALTACGFTVAERYEDKGWICLVCRYH